MTLFLGSPLWLWLAEWPVPSDGDLGDGPQVTDTGGPAAQGFTLVTPRLSLTSHTHTPIVTHCSHCHNTHMVTLDSLTHI